MCIQLHTHEKIHSALETKRWVWKIEHNCSFYTVFCFFCQMMHQFKHKAQVIWASQLITGKINSPRPEDVTPSNTLQSLSKHNLPRNITNSSELIFHYTVINTTLEIGSFRILTKKKCQFKVTWTNLSFKSCNLSKNLIFQPYLLNLLALWKNPLYLTFLTMWFIVWDDSSMRGLYIVKWLKMLKMWGLESVRRGRINKMAKLE